MKESASNLIEEIITHARWAPSGDNMQTWRFEIKNDKQFVVHGYDTRDHCVYDLQGRASQIAIGALLENISIAATAFAHGVEFKLRESMPESQPTIDVTLLSQANIEPDPLFSFLPKRSVQRRSLKTIRLTREQKVQLELAVGNFYSLYWLEGLKSRWQAAWLMFNNGKLRLTLPEAFPTHSSIIEWNVRFSEDRIPDQAIGLDPIAMKLMAWALKSWQRVKFLNTYFMGTLLPRIELDLVPGVFCAAHFAILAKEQPSSIEDYIQAGRALQRFWLTATKLGLQLQPEMTPLIFSGYVRDKVIFTQQAQLMRYAEGLAEYFERLFGKSNIDRIVFVGRIGSGAVAYSRSIRLPLNRLLVSVENDQK